MDGERNLAKLVKGMEPEHHAGDYVFCVVINLEDIDLNEIILFFKEPEGYTIIVKQDLADRLKLGYSFIAAWITLTVHSSLSAVGFTATFSTALADAGISCNVVAAFYHDHIFVDKKDVDQTLAILKGISEAS